MKKILILTTLALSSITSTAQDYHYLTVSTSTTDKSIPLAIVQKITFKDNNVIVTTTQGTEAFPQQEMQAILFEDSPTEINTIPIQSPHLNIERGILTAPQQGLLHIYTPNGTLHSLTRTEADTQIDLNTLPQGTYIIKLNNHTIKYTRQ